MEALSAIGDIIVQISAERWVRSVKDEALSRLILFEVAGLHGYSHPRSVEEEDDGAAHPQAAPVSVAHASGGTRAACR